MITTGQASIGTVATIIDGTFNSEFQLTVHNMDNTDTMFLGGEDVTIANGLGLGKGQFIQIQMKPGDFLHAVSPKSGHFISWMKQV